MRGVSVVKVWAAVLVCALASGLVCVATTDPAYADWFDSDCFFQFGGGGPCLPAWALLASEGGSFEVVAEETASGTFRAGYALYLADDGLPVEEYFFDSRG